MTAILPILQLLLAALPEFEALWPVLSKLLVTGQPPQPADMATLWAAAAAAHARVQAGGLVAPAASPAAMAAAVSNPGALT